MKKSSEQYRTKCPICGERYIEYKDFETDGKTGWMERWCTHSQKKFPKGITVKQVNCLLDFLLVL